MRIVERRVARSMGISRVAPSAVAFTAWPEVVLEWSIRVPNGDVQTGDRPPPVSLGGPMSDLIQDAQFKTGLFQGSVPGRTA
jgi:hypothetical protein